MNLELLRKGFTVNEAVSPVGTGAVLTSPAVLSKDMSSQLADQLPLDQVMNVIATTLAREMGAFMITKAMRPADYATLSDIPDSLIERTIEALASKPDVFFKVFRDQMKMQG